MKKLQTPKEIARVVPRIKSFALGAGKQQSHPVMIMGVDTNSERYLSKPQKRLEKGSYFTRNDGQAVLIGHLSAAKRFDI